MLYALLDRIQGIVQPEPQPQTGRYEDQEKYSGITRTRLHQRHNSVSNPISPIRLPLHHHRRPDSPDSPAYRARGGRRHAIRLATRRFTTTLRRVGITLESLKWVAGVVVLALFYLWWKWEVHIEIAFYKRSWVEEDIKKVEPLAGCFDAGKLSSAYNITAARGPKTFEIQAGLPLRLGMDCYDFAGTIQKPPSMLDEPHNEPKTVFHTYWRKDLVPFGDRQAWMMRSFFATQDLSRAAMILWSNEDLSKNPWVAAFLRNHPDSFSTKIVDVDLLARDTALARSSLLRRKDDKAWVDGDLVRLLVTWEYGGVWIDMDTLLTRDLSPLLEHEFVTQWDCYDKIYQPLNGALMNFHKHSPYLCEAFHLMAQSPPPRSGTTDWGSTLYLKLWRRLIAAEIPPFKVLPFCFSDGRSCRLDNRLPDPFLPDPKNWGGGRSLAEGKELDNVLGKVFAVHLHNQWEKIFPPGGWVERLLLQRYERKLGGDTLRRPDV